MRRHLVDRQSDTVLRNILDTGLPPHPHPHPASLPLNIHTWTHRTQPIKSHLAPRMRSQQHRRWKPDGLEQGTTYTSHCRIHRTNPGGVKDITFLAHRVAQSPQTMGRPTKTFCVCLYLLSLAQTLYGRNRLHSLTHENPREKGIVVNWGLFPYSSH